MNDKIKYDRLQNALEFAKLTTPEMDDEYNEIQLILEDYRDRINQGIAIAGTLETCKITWVTILELFKKIINPFGFQRGGIVSHAEEMKTSFVHERSGPDGEPPDCRPEEEREWDKEFKHYK